MSRSLFFVRFYICAKINNPVQRRENTGKSSIIPVPKPTLHRKRLSSLYRKSPHSLHRSASAHTSLSHTSFFVTNCNPEKMNVRVHYAVQTDRHHQIGLLHTTSHIYIRVHIYSLYTRVLRTYALDRIKSRGIVFFVENRWNMMGSA